ncbi:YraN family protein [Chloroflexota bacterium]
MSDKRRHLGALGERLAADYLRRQGYVILDTNFRFRQGEIDIIASHHEYLVFVKVRTKRIGGPMMPEESITEAKREN